ncbi:unnamed protein product, partial [Prorocentrum cordatum]
ELNGPSSDFPPPPLVSILHPRISLPPPASPKRDRGGAKESWERSALYAQNPDFLEGARHLVDFVAETPEIVPGLQGILPSGLRRGAVPGAAAARVPEPALRPRRARRPAPAAAPAQPLRGPRRAHRRPGAGPQRHPERPGARDLLCAQHRAPAAGRGRPAGRRRGSRGRRLERRLGGAGAQGRGGRGRGGGGARPVREGAARLAEDGGGRRGGPDARRRRLEHGAAAPQPGGLERSFGPARAVHGLENGQGGGAARRDARHLSGGAVWWAASRRALSERLPEAYAVPDVVLKCDGSNITRGPAPPPAPPRLRRSLALSLSLSRAAGGHWYSLGVPGPEGGCPSARGISVGSSAGTLEASIVLPPFWRSAEVRTPCLQMGTRHGAASQPRFSLHFCRGSSKTSLEGNQLSLLLVLLLPPARGLRLKRAVAGSASRFEIVIFFSSLSPSLSRAILDFRTTPSLLLRPWPPSTAERLSTPIRSAQGPSLVLTTVS